MNLLREWWRRLRYLVNREQADQDLEEEMRLHLELREAERAGQGATPSEARAEARRRFGNVAQLGEAGREAWGWAWLDSLLQDIRYGVRALASHPGFTLTALLSLALGIGANTAIFSIVNAVMLRSLPVENPQQLVEIRSGRDNYFTNPIWEQVRDHQQAFTGTLAFSPQRFDLSNGGESHFAQGLWVSGDFFSVLGVSPFLGRVLTPADDVHGGGKAGPVAVISYAFWKSHFAGDPQVVGKTVRLNRHLFEIVGVAPAWFRGLDVDTKFDVAVPIGTEPILDPAGNSLEQRSWWWLRMLGRLPHGETLQQAGARMNSIAPEVNRATLPTDWEQQDKDEYLKRRFTLASAATGFSGIGDRYSKSLFILMGVVGLVLLIACANIANLLLARAAARQHEVSVRLAIGAGRRRVIRQLLTESFLLALVGAAGGLGFAFLGSSVLIRMLSTSRDPLEINVSPDLHVLAFTTVIAILTGLLFGLAPAFRATKISANQILHKNSDRSFGRPGSFRLGKTLVAAQVAMSLVLLIGAGLFLGTLRNLLTRDSGFNWHHVLLVNVFATDAVPKEQRRDLYHAILERLQHVPGVKAAASSMLTPVSFGVWNEYAYAEGYEAKSRDDTLTYFNRVSPGYFKTMQMPLLLGRDFTSHDTLASPKVMVINETAARHFFGQANPLGKTIALDVMGKPGVKEDYQVVGVAKDSDYRRLGEETLRQGFLALGQDPDPWPGVAYEVRTPGKVEGLRASIASVVGNVNGEVSLEFKDYETAVSDSLLQQRLVATLSAFFGGLALLLAMVGLYGVTSYGVTRRRGEIGIRMALGAERRSVVWLILRDVLVMLAFGTVLGVAAALAAGKVIASLLYGVEPADPMTLAAAIFILTAATALAGYLPARRASHLDPMAALREE